MQLGQITTQTLDGACRVSVDVAGVPLWFESSDAELAPHSEAFASALMFPSLKRRHRLELSSPVSAAWLEGVKQLQSSWREWWDYPLLEPQAAVSSPEISAGPDDRALCFTGGIDSIYNLLHHGEGITHLLYVEGYDVRLREGERLADIRNSLQKVAEASGRKLLILKSNLRDHPAFKKVSWEHAHGSALVASGYVLSRVVGSLVIPSSYKREVQLPWGSSLHTDHLWSTPFLKVIHGDASLYRFDKTQELANEPLAQKYLRVCFQRNIDGLNCSSCEKCVRTMIALDASGMLQRFKTFDHSVPLTQRIDAIPKLPPHLLTTYGNLHERDYSTEGVKEAIGRLLERSHQQASRLSWRGIWSRLCRSLG